MRSKPSPPPDLAGFAFVELLGSGGFADVFEYTQLALGRQVAVKVLTSGVDAADLAAFQAEASVMAQLSNHPSIVSIYQADVTMDGRPYLVMEYCPPPHLGVQIRNRPPSLAKALEIVVQVAGAVETSHRLGILHRDIKPANILFTEFGRPALTDFGISVTTYSGAAGGGVGMSVPWAPPEQLSSGMPMSETGDVYSLAATLWTILVGHAPFHVPGGSNEPFAMAPRVRTAPVPRTGRVDVPDSLERALRTAMAKDPAERYDSALAFARALQGVQAELHQPVTAIEVRDDRTPGERDDGLPEPSGTHVSGFISIDPVATPVVRTPEPASRLEHTVLGVSAAPVLDPLPGPEVGVPVDPYASGTGPAVAAEPGTERSEVRRIAVAVLAVLVLAAVVVVVLLGNGKGTPDRTAQHDPGGPSDPLGSNVVPAPTDVRVTRIAGETRVHVTWKNPEPEDGDTYIVKLIDPSAEPAWTPVTHPYADVRTRTGRECVYVAIVRVDRTSSNAPAQGCPGGGR